MVCKDKLYVVGGGDAEGTDLASVEVYDFATEAWSILPAPMPQGRTNISNAWCNTKATMFTWVGMVGEDISRVWQCTTLPLKNGACCRLKCW